MGSVTKVLNLMQHIGDGEILTSSRLLERIRSCGVTEANARQMLHRCAESPHIWRSNHLVLPGGGRFFARRNFLGTDAFIEQCLPLLAKFRPGVGRAALALRQEEIILRPHAELLLASPIFPDNSDCPPYEADARVLHELGIGRLDATDSVLERMSYVKLDDRASHALAIRARARFTAEVALANLLFEKFRQQNWTSWNTKALPDASAMLAGFNNFQFYATGFSWLKPMLRIKAKEKPKPAPVVLDVYAKTCLPNDVESFAERITRAGQNKNRKLTFLGILAAFDFDKAAWKLAKSNGFITLNLHQYFGDAAFEALVQVQELLQNVAGEPGRANEDDYKRLAETLDQLKNNPYVVDLRSLGFESVAGLILRTKGYDNVHLNLKVALSSSEERELDVSGDRNGHTEYFLIECKAEGATKMLDPWYVRKFYTETVPSFIRTSKSPGIMKECRAEIWTTGQVGEDAKTALAEIEMNPLIKPALLGHAAVKQQVPNTLNSCKRLIEAISSH